jgi:hypothetical protein
MLLINPDRQSYVVLFLMCVSMSGEEKRTLPMGIFLRYPLIRLIHCASHKVPDASPQIYRHTHCFDYYLLLATLPRSL